MSTFEKLVGRRDIPSNSKYFLAYPWRFAPRANCDGLNLGKARCVIYGVKHLTVVHIARGNFAVQTKFYS